MRTADNCDGTFTNPLIFADYPDPDIIRAGDDFYLASSSFTDAPGIPILHSKDLVNWRTAGHVYQRLPEDNPAYSMQGGQVAYRGGSWAPSLRHHRGLFFVAYCMPNEGFFLARSEKPEGPWDITHFGGIELYDPGLFFDDDGRVYVVHGANDIYLTELTADARAIAGQPRLLYSSAHGNPLEGSHAYKLRGRYYLCQTSRAYNGLQLIYRSDQIHGPYEWRLLTADDINYSGAGLHQGGFVDLADGELWFCLFQDRDYVGRVPILMPVHWRDGWPTLGEPGNFGKIAITRAKPRLPTSAPCVPQESDSFDRPQLGLAWNWNHNPDDSRWSLTERPGWMRLRSSQAGDLLHARNTLTQKITGGGCTATTRIDVRQLAEGDLAGLCILGFPHAYIAVQRASGRNRLVMVNDGRRVAECPPAAIEEVWLSAEADCHGVARFSYSHDGEQFAPLGDELVMQFSVKSFLGNKFGLFCFNPTSEAPAGWADFDFLRYHCQRGPANHFSAGEEVPATAYDAEHGVDTLRIAEKRPDQVLSCLHDGDWFRFNHLDCRGGVDRITLRALAIGSGGFLEIRILGPDGPCLARCELTGNGQRWPWLCVWETKTFQLPRISGIQTLCFCVRGEPGERMRIDHFRLHSETAAT